MNDSKNVSTGHRGSRYCKNVDEREISQVVVLKGLREKVLMMAHDAVMSGHQGQKKKKQNLEIILVARI